MVRKATCASDEAWAVGHRAALRVMRLGQVAGGVGAVAIVLTFLLSDGAAALRVGLAGPAFVVVLFVAAALGADRAARKVAVSSSVAPNEGG